MSKSFNTGERIRELRIEKGLSQEQLALRADITTTYLGLVERNAKNPTIKVIEQLCDSLNVSLAEFFSTATETSQSLDSVSMQIVSQFSNRTEEEKQMILQIIKSVLKLRDLSMKEPVEE